MARTRKPTYEELLRLEKIAQKLGTQSRWPAPSFTQDVTAACLRRVAPLLKREGPQTGEDVALALSHHLSVRFEEVRSPADIQAVTEKYLRQQELGFGQIPDELSGDVDALLFTRNRAGPNQDQFVAVLNLQDGENRAFWSRFHELGHRIAEPRQLTLPLRRHRFEATSPLEQIIDHVAGALAFYAPLFRPRVLATANRKRLTLAAVEELRDAYAPTASLQASMNSVVKEWPQPALALTASYRGRKGNPEKDQALRVSPQARNNAAVSMRLSPFSNMRVPRTSPIFTAYATNSAAEGFEDLGRWTTSRGISLPGLTVYASALPLGETVYAVISIPGRQR